MEALGSTPFVSQAVSAFNYGSVPVPALSTLNSVADSISYANRSKSTEKKVKHYTGAALMGAGAVVGLPAALQTKQLINKVLD